MDIKEFLVRELNRREEFTKSFKEKIPLEEFEQSQSDNDTETVALSKEVVMDYLLKSGYDLTPENYERAEQMLASMEGNKLKSTLKNAGNMEQKKYKTIDHLNDLSIEELNSLLNVAILNALNTISEQTERVARYTYAIEVINDRGGGTDVKTLSSVINRYAADGYRVVNVFTNELGKNATSIGGFGVNSTVDQVVVIFEKEVR